MKGTIHSTIEELAVKTLVEVNLSTDGGSEIDATDGIRSLLIKLIGYEATSKVFAEADRRCTYKDDVIDVNGIEMIFSTELGAYVTTPQA